MKRLYVFLIALCVSFGVMQQPASIYANDDETKQQEDINIIKERLKTTFLQLDTIDDGAKVEAAYVSKAKEYLDTMEDDGSWADVNYEARDNAANGKAWSPYLALDRMQAIAIAYYKPENELYQKPEVIDALNKALLHWKKVKPSSTNWWENDIGVNLRFGRIGLFLENDLSEDALNVIINSLNEEGKFQGTGQNNLWYDQNAMYRALITNDGEQLTKVLDECLSYVLVLQTDNTTKEALQVDNSLYFHGVQFYSNGYGLSMFRDMSFWLYHLRDTSFALDSSIVDRMSDYMLDGSRWTIRGDIAELYLGYRPYKVDVNFTNYAQEYVQPLEYMKVVDTARASEYNELIENIKGNRKDNGISGNNYMWRVGYATHMRDGYGVNIKMDSKRILGGEWRGSWPSGEDQGNLIYWTSSAASSYVVDGDEYTNVYPTYDWRHVPGVTVQNEIHKGYANYGRFNNGTDHTIGVSDGTYGSTAYDMNKSGTQVKKSYFFFDDEIVALGSGITSTSGSEIHTTLNQAQADNVSVNGVNVADNTTNKEYTGNWMYNDKIGYVFPETTKVVVSNATQKDMPSLWSEDMKESTPSTFKAYINHGVKPSDDSYSYIVVPNKTAEEVEAYSEDNPIEVIKNTKEIQAVTHKELKITQVNFYKAGGLEYAPGKVVSVDKPANIIIDESGSTTFITLAMTDTDYNKNAVVTLTKDGTTSTTTFVLNQAPYTGQSATLPEGKTNEQTASSSINNQGVELAFDEDTNTQWKSEVGEDQWVVKNLNKKQFVSSLTINWGSNYAKKYKIQGSYDGQNYFDISEILEGKDTTTVDLNTVTSYLKITLLESNNKQGYEINEVTIKTGENIALKKNIEVSSTSTNDPGNIASHAVDGDTSTRWSSLRNSNNEWATVNLAGNYDIYAMNIKWESARSGKYTIDVSSDNKNWQTVKTIEESTNLDDQILFEDGIKANYVRINSTKSVSEKYGISIFEIEIYGDLNEPQEQPENIALGKEAYASSSYTNPYTQFVLEPKYAVDGSVVDNGNTFQSRWVSARESDNEWIYVDLAGKYNVNKVVLNWEGAYGKEYIIQVSNDALTWKDIVVVNDGKAGIKEFDLSEEQEAQYVRVQGVKPATKYGYSLWEFEVYGTKVDESSVDKEALANLIASVDALNEEDYVPQSWSDMQEVLTQAKEVFNSTASTQDEVNEAAQKLEEAIQSLEELVPTADKQELIALVSSVSTLNKDDYTPESWGIFETALTNAQLIIDKQDATQENVDKAKQDLMAARSQLVLNPEVTDKEQLKTLIASVAALNKDDYTDTTWKQLELALTNANSVINDELATKDDIASAEVMLSNAIHALIQKITGIEDTYSIKVGDVLVLNPKPSSGVLYIDDEYLMFTEISRTYSGSASIKAIKAGTTTIKYVTPQGEVKTAEITIAANAVDPGENTDPTIPGGNNTTEGSNSSTASDNKSTPVTGVSDTSQLYWGLLLLSGILGISIYKHKKKTSLKKH